MFVIPVSPALSADPEQSSFNFKKHPSFGLSVTPESRRFLEKATDLALANPESRLAQQLTRLMEVLDEVEIRNDGLQLVIDNPLWEGIQSLTVDARVKLENLGRVVEGKAQSLTKTITNLGDTLEGETIIDVALRLLADKNGKALHPIWLNEAITNAQERFSNGIEQVRVNVVDPLRRKISSFWTPETQAS